MVVLVSGKKSTPNVLVGDAYTLVLGHNDKLACKNQAEHSEVMPRVQFNNLRLNGRDDKWNK